jgi:hypothetical protein
MGLGPVPTLLTTTPVSFNKYLKGLFHMELKAALSLCLLLSACSTNAKKDNSNVPSGLPPKLLAPSVRKIWMPPQLKDGGQEWEEGHFLYRIERGTSWSR